MNQGTRAAVGAAALIGLLATAGPAVAKDRVIAVDGVSKSNADRRVEILVHVPEGQDANAAAEKALAEQNAKRAPKPPAPPQSNSYSFTGLFWDSRRVTQNYNPVGSRNSGAQTALTNTLPDWSTVSGADFRISFGGNTNRCPSLVRECPGAQRNDLFNDVGWAQLSNGTLGVTWSTSGTDEADMAINTRYTWTTGCTAQPGAFDLESVILHENGHVAGLGHSTNINAVMYPSYQTARCSLAADDRAGIAALYSRGAAAGRWGGPWPPPAPAAPPAIQTARWLLRPISFLESCRRRHGELFSVRFLGFRTPMVMTSDPAAIRALYTERRHGLPPGRGVALLPVVGPRSVLLLEGSEHLARRKLMLPPFHGERMRAYEATVRDVVERDVAGWPRGEPFAVHPRMQAVTLEVIVRAVFGVTDPARGQRLRELLRGLLDATASFGLQFGFMLARRVGAPDPLEKLRRQRAQIDELLLAEIGERRAAGGGEDILSLLLDARFEDGAPMADQEVCDQLVTLLVAGHETTATALAWTLELLVHHPDALARLGDGSDAAYLKAVISESLRLRPVVPLAGRRLSQPLQVDGVELPEGTDVTPAIWLAHTRADVYPEPFAFRPERWLDGSPPPGYAWVPFGGGVRRCLGAAFAEMEMRVALATMLSLVRVQAATADPERVARRNVTFSPAKGTRLVAWER